MGTDEKYKILIILKTNKVAVKKVDYGRSTSINTERTFEMLHMRKIGVLSLNGNTAITYLTII